MAIKLKTGVVFHAGDTSAISDDLSAEWEAQLGEAAEKVADIARRLVPVRTGALRTSIKAYKSKYPDGGWIVYADFPAHLIEFGHANVKKGNVVGHVPARPFLRPALTAVVNQWLHTARAMRGGAYDERG